ncbi:MAG: recombination regulator RecX [Betaproteobacteria bacterium]
MTDPSARASTRGAQRLAQLSLKGRALRLLAGREHSRAELERKLAEHAQDPDELTRILDDLQAKGFINEARVVESVVHRRSERLGSARIAHELRGKGLAPEVVAQAVGQLQASELERARALWSRKFGQAPSEAKEQARQMRFLLSRGFNAEVVRKVLAQDD